jgi:uncharacterized protein
MTGERDLREPDAERHARVPGYDVARAVAICGMVLINFGVYLLGPPRGTPIDIALRWLAHVPGGRASSLFVTLAGVGIARMAYGDATLARNTLLKRSALLLVLGITNLLLGWWIDILHFYACYLAIAAVFFLRATPRALLGSAIVLGLAGGVLAFALPEDGRSHIAYSTIELARAAWTDGVAPTVPWIEIARQCAVAALRDALLDGIHPVVPWLAFLLYGMWLGRLDLRASALRRTVLARALAVFLGTEILSITLSALTIRNESPSLAPIFTLVHTDWSPSPLYVLSAAATATCVIALAHELVERAPKNAAVRLLGNAGQLSLTIYLVHAHLAIGIPRFALHLADAFSIEEMLAYWLAFVAVVLPLAALYRTRFTRGPVEWLMRRLTGSPDHVPPLVEAQTPSREPPRWVWPLALGVATLLPLADLLGVAPPQTSCAARAGLSLATHIETPGQLTLLCPRARYAITLDAPTPLVIATRSGLDVYLEVRREGVMIVEDDDSGPGLDARITATLGPGRYDVDVRPYSAATGPFVLSIARDASRDRAAP